MTKFRFVAILAAGAAIQFVPFGQTASAADLPSLKDTPYVLAPNWAGLYFGGHAGGVWGDTVVHDTFTYVGDPSADPKLSGTGFIGGAQAGYNFQRGHVVFGPEVDIGYMNISASGSHAYVPGSCTGNYTAGTKQVTYNAANGDAQLCNVNAKYSSSGDLYGDLTARLGYSMDRTLFYVKGGAAFLDADVKAQYAGQNCTTLTPGSKGSCAFTAGAGGPSMFSAGQSGTLAGWTIGGGAEYAISPSWLFKAEYQHFDFGTVSYSYAPAAYVIPCTGCSHTGGHYTSTISGKTDASITADAVTLGVNYHLGNDAGTK